MCSCNLRRGSASALQASGITNFIPAKDLNSGETTALFMMIDCVGHEKVNKALSNFKLPNGSPLALNSKDDVKYLAAIYDSGKAKELWNADLKNILLGIEFSQDELNNAACTTGILVD